MVIRAADYGKQIFKSSFAGMLKRSFVLLLTLVFLYNSAGYISVLDMLKERLYSSFLVSERGHEGPLLRFSRKDPLVSAACDRREISREGRLYDVVRQDAEFYYCWHDSEEESLVHIIREFVKEQLDKGKPRPDSKIPGKVSAKDYLATVSPPSYAVQTPAVRRFFYSVPAPHKGFSTLVMPPPRLA